jgi:hypothetical protein
MAACGRGSAPYVAVAGGELTTAKPTISGNSEPDPGDPAPARPPTRWIKDLSNYNRRETTWMHGSRFG